MELIKKILKKKRKLAGKLAVLVLAFQVCSKKVYAAKSIAKSKIFTGTTDLFTDLQTPLIALSAIIAIVMILFNLIKIKMADDETDTKMYKKRIKIIICCAIGAVVIVTLLPIILSYYE